ncbi:hypothetical protein ABB37_05111 [Acetobacter orientalis]|uniref:Uncharacterized protein n=1 Tax=Acetobacter orientalis TaxID=146474 RepID=A0A2Z5ZEL6_9PROT|nr:hypothetical protein ABB37_05111 [Acetobacter orientalis]
METSVCVLRDLTDFLVQCCRVVSEKERMLLHNPLVGLSRRPW